MLDGQPPGLGAVAGFVDPETLGGQGKRKPLSEGGVLVGDERRAQHLGNRVEVG